MTPVNAANSFSVERGLNGNCISASTAGRKQRGSLDTYPGASRAPSPTLFASPPALRISRASDAVRKAQRLKRTKSKDHLPVRIPITLPVNRGAEGGEGNGDR